MALCMKAPIKSLKFAIVSFLMMVAMPAWPSRRVLVGPSQGQVAAVSTAAAVVES
jgi:hypothetical protein